MEPPLLFRRPNRRGGFDLVSEANAAKLGYDLNDGTWKSYGAYVSLPGDDPEEILNSDLDQLEVEAVTLADHPRKSISETAQRLLGQIDCLRVALATNAPASARKAERLIGELRATLAAAIARANTGRTPTGEHERLERARKIKNEVDRLIRNGSCASVTDAAKKIAHKEEFDDLAIRTIQEECRYAREHE